MVLEYDLSFSSYFECWFVFHNLGSLKSSAWSSGLLQLGACKTKEFLLFVKLKFLMTNSATFFSVAVSHEMRNVCTVIRDSTESDNGEIITTSYSHYPMFPIFRPFRVEVETF